MQCAVLLELLHSHLIGRSVTQQLCRSVQHAPSHQYMFHGTMSVAKEMSHMLRSQGQSSSCSMLAFAKYPLLLLPSPLLLLLSPDGRVTMVLGPLT